jgi:Fe-S cluster assembly protein SufD
MYTDISNDKKKTYKITSAGTHVFFVHNRDGEIIFSIEKEGAEVLVFGLYEGEKKEAMTLQTTQLHKAPRTKSSVLIKGVFTDQARFDFEGLIRMEKNAQKTESYLTNNNLLLSSDAHVDTRPMLEILPDDVICTHSATVSRVSDEQLHFLRTRGFNKKTAEKILIDGFVQDLHDQLDPHKK